MVRKKDWKELAIPIEPDVICWSGFHLLGDDCPWYLTQCFLVESLPQDRPIDQHLISYLLESDCLRVNFHFLLFKLFSGLWDLELILTIVFSLWDKVFDFELNLLLIEDLDGNRLFDAFQKLEDLFERPIRGERSKTGILSAELLVFVLNILGGATPVFGRELLIEHASNLLPRSAHHFDEAEQLLLFILGPRSMMVLRIKSPSAEVVYALNGAIWQTLSNLAPEFLVLIV